MKREFGNSKLNQIISQARDTVETLRGAGLSRHADVVSRLIKSRISAHSENVRCNREYREALALIAKLEGDFDRLMEETKCEP